MRIKIILIIILCIPILYYCLIYNHPLYNNELFFIFINYLISCFFYLLHINKNGLKYYYPTHIYFIFYTFIFTIAPFVLIANGKEDCYGVNIMGGCYRGTLAASLSVCAFMLGFMPLKETKKRLPRITINKIPTNIKNKIIRVSLYLFFFSFIVSAYYQISRGLNLTFLLSFGTNDVVDIENSKDPRLFLTSLNYSMIAPWLIYFFIGKNKILKIILTYLLISILFLRGSRFLFYLSIVAFIISYYRINNKTPNLKIISIVFLGILTFSIFMGNARRNMRQGKSFENTELFTKEQILWLFESNFQIYKPFYGVTNTYPNKDPYTIYTAMITDPLIMWIPRIIWPSKPTGAEYTTTTAIQRSVKKEAITKHALAMPNLADYYIDLGFLGVFLYSLLLGIIARKWTRHYYSNNIFKLISYTIFVGALINVINRGYMPSILTLFAFLYLPIVILQKIAHIKKTQSNIHSKDFQLLAIIKSQNFLFNRKYQRYLQKNKSTLFKHNDSYQ